MHKHNHTKREDIIAAFKQARADIVDSNRPARYLDAIIAELEAAAPSAAAPEISTAHGPWLPSRYDEGETYCERCLTRSVFADKRKCEPHIVSAPQAASEPVATQAARDVLAERQRQISTEGYTPEHDDEHGAEEFGRAASVYANSHVYDVIGASYMGWPWDEAWYKPTTQRRDFVKAAALLLAGIECIDRATLSNGLTEVETSATASVAGLSGDAEREAFEAWFVVEGDPGFLVRRPAAPDEYVEPDVQASWEAWQARAALHSTGKPGDEQ